MLRSVRLAIVRRPGFDPSMARPSMPVLSWLLYAGAAALVYVGVTSRRAAAPGAAPGGVAPPPRVGTPSPGSPADREEVRERYEEYQTQLGFPGGLNVYRGNPGVLRTLAEDLDRVGLTIAAADVRRSLQQIAS